MCVCVCANSELSEKADLKITVYHKSSIIDEFLGRAMISLTELIDENRNSITRHDTNICTAIESEMSKLNKRMKL